MKRNLSYKVLIGCHVLPLAGASIILFLVYRPFVPRFPYVWHQWGPAIAGNGEYDEFGSSVAPSVDARTMVIGAPGNIHDPCDLKKSIRQS